MDFIQDEIEIIRKHYPKLGKKMFYMVPRHSGHSIISKTKQLKVKVLCLPLTHRIPHDDAVYLAAIIDGEGSIGMWERTGRICCYNPQIAVYNTNRKLIYWISKTISPIPHRIHIDKRGSLIHKISYNLAIRGIPATYTILKMISPYLKIKNEQAELLLEFDKSRIGRPIRQLNSDRDHRIYDRLRKLNKKGP